MDIAENIRLVRQRIEDAASHAGRDPASVTLIGASKGASPALVQAALTAGLFVFGENFVQEAEERIAALGATAARANWHFIGHLQTNKVAAVLGFASLVHSVDTLRLAEAIDRRARARVRVLLEVNVAREGTKFGFDPDEVAGAVSRAASPPNLELVGLMTMAPAVPDPELVRPVFRDLRLLAAANGLSGLSMGMTDDFEVAIEEGATMVRVGRAIFGERRS
jgi:pyridoxal phosphate enzyme (YggS family)